MKTFLYLGNNVTWVSSAEFADRSEISVISKSNKESEVNDIFYKIF